MKVQVRYFASVREALGAGEMLDVPQAASVAQIRQTLSERSAAHAQALDRRHAVRAALDHVMCGEDAIAREGSEVAFFPPVTGG